MRPTSLSVCAGAMPKFRSYLDISPFPEETVVVPCPYWGPLYRMGYKEQNVEKNVRQIAAWRVRCGLSTGVIFLAKISQGNVYRNCTVKLMRKKSIELKMLVIGQVTLFSGNLCFLFLTQDG